MTSRFYLFVAVIFENASTREKYTTRLLLLEQQYSTV